MKDKKITKKIAVSKDALKRMRSSKGGSNVGKYSNVSRKDFSGTSGGAPQGSYPINTKQRAKSALELAHNAPNPQGIKNKVYSKYPSLKKER